MGVGVLEVQSDEAVPGTIHLEHVKDNTDIDETLSTLKHAQGKNDERIILAPQPSNDPNDPLNWSISKKAFVIAITYSGTVLHTATTALLLASGNVQIAKDLDIPLSKMVELSLGDYLLPAGAACPFVIAFARKYGKRPVYVLSSTVATVGCFVGATAAGYDSLLTARVLQGIGQTAYESLVFNTVADTLFVHQRGPPVAFGVFSINAIANIVGIIAGTITHQLGWRYCFWILLPLAMLQTLLVALFVPETSFVRETINESDPILDTEIGPSSGSASPPRREQEISKIRFFEAEEAVIEHSAEYSPPPRKSWVQELRLYNGAFVDDPIWRILISFPVILLNLGVSFAVVGCGLTLTWFAATITVSTVRLPSPPWNFTSSQVGFASVAPAIGAMLASLFMALCSDRLIRKLTHHNHGVYEPEFQLPLTFIGGSFIIAGIVSLGYTLERGEPVYIVCVCWAISSFGFACCTTTYINYALSAFQDYSNEIIVMSVLFRNFLGYGMSIFIVPWLENDGSLKLFSIQAATMAATLVLVALFYVFGKKYRHFWHHHNVLKIWGLEAGKTDDSKRIALP